MSDICYPQIDMTVYEPGDLDNKDWMVKVRQHRTEVFSREYPTKAAAEQGMHDLWQEIENATMDLRRKWATKIG